MSTEKKIKIKLVTVGASIVWNVPSRSLNQLLKEYFSVVKSFPGATTQNTNDCIKPTIARKPDMVILHIGTNNLKSLENLENFRKFINEYVWCSSQGDNIVIQYNDIPLNTTRNAEDVSSSSPLKNSNGSEEKDPKSFLKDIEVKNINHLITGQLKINSLRNKFEQLSGMINGNIDIFMISETKADETFPAAQLSLQGFCDP